MKAIEVDVVSPIYENYDDVSYLYESLKKQKNIILKNVVFPLTIGDKEKTDKLRQFIKDNNIVSFEVEKKDFVHSLTRQKAIEEYCKSKCIVMLSQDVKIKDENALYNLVKSIDNDETVHNYGRQICTNHSIERYVRKKNYPDYSWVDSKKTIKKDIKPFFSSDAFSAYNRDVFIKLGGYNGYKVMMSEDMLYVYFALMAGYKKGYVSEAVVEHSHKYTIKQLYRRYYANGEFFRDVKLFDKYSTSGGGLRLALYVLGQSLIHFNIPALIRWLPDMAARYIGMKKGRKAKKE